MINATKIEGSELPSLEPILWVVSHVTKMSLVVKGRASPPCACAAVLRSEINHTGRREIGDFRAS